MADMVQRGLGDRVPLADRVVMQTASIETNRLLCMMASAAAKYHIEEILQVCDPPRSCVIAEVPSATPRLLTRAFRMQS